MRCSCLGGALFLLHCRRPFGHSLQWFLTNSCGFNCKLCDLTWLQAWMYTSFYLHGRGTCLCRAHWDHFSFSEGAKHQKVTCYCPHRTFIWRSHTSLWQKQTEWRTWFEKKSCLKTIYNFSVINMLLSVKIAISVMGSMQLERFLCWLQAAHRLLEATADTCDGKTWGEQVPVVHSCLCSFGRLRVTTAACFALYWR